MHKHKCLKCGHVWQHGKHSLDNKKAHTCPCCHTNPDQSLGGLWPWYEGAQHARKTCAKPTFRVGARAVR